MIPNKLTDFELIEFLTHFGERISQQVIAHCINKLSLVEMQLDLKYISGIWSKRRNSTYIFQVVASLPTKVCSYYWHHLHWHRQFTILPNC
jgi:hypothetical protein